MGKTTIQKIAEMVDSDFILKLQRFDGDIASIKKYFNIEHNSFTSYVYEPKSDEDVLDLIEFQRRFVLYIDEEYIVGLDVEIGKKYILCLSYEDDTIFMSLTDNFLNDEGETIMKKLSPEEERELNSLLREMKYEMRQINKHSEDIDYHHEAIRKCEEDIHELKTIIIKRFGKDIVDFASLHSECEEN